MFQVKGGKGYLGIVERVPCPDLAKIHGHSGGVNCEEGRGSELWALWGRKSWDGVGIVCFAADMDDDHKEVGNSISCMCLDEGFLPDVKDLHGHNLDWNRMQGRLPGFDIHQEHPRVMWTRTRWLGKFVLRNRW